MLRSERRNYRRKEWNKAEGKYKEEEEGAELNRVS